MAIEKKPIPVAPWKGLHLDGVTVPGGLSKAENIIILPDGSAERRGYVRTFAESPACLASRGFKSIFEYKKSDGSRILFADMDYAGPLMKITGSDITGTTEPDVTWTSVLTGLTTGTTVHPKWATLQDRAFRVDGTNANYVFTSKTSYGSNGVTKPAAAPVLGETTGGSLTLLGEYNVYYTYVKYDGRFGTEKITGATALSTWSDPADWAYASAKWTHTSGTTALVANWTPTSGLIYELTVTHTTTTASSGYSITCGGVTIATGVTTGATTSYIFKATNTNALTFTPSTGWSGSITAVSVLLADYKVESNPCPVANTTLTSTNNAITVTTVASSDANVSFIRLYRTLYGTPLGSAYYDQEVLNASAAYTMTNSDDSIRDINSVLISAGAPVPIVKYVVACGSRMFYLNAPGEVGGSGTMWWSTLDKPESVPALNFQTFDANDGDELMGGVGLHNNILVFKRRKFWMCDIYSTDTNVNYDGTVTASLAKHIVSSTIGCIASGSIQAIGDINGAIWLSAEGIMLYAGGELKNISKDKINTPIYAAIANADCTDFIESVYQAEKRLYHINILYKNAAGDAIVGQRHFVYSLTTDTWTEYVYYSDAGVRYYETNFAIIDDANDNDVFISAYLTTVSSTTTYIYHQEYTPTETTPGAYIKIIDSDGDGSTDLKSPLFSLSDSSDNIYIICANNIFKITQEAEKSLLVSQATLISTCGVSLPFVFTIEELAKDLTNGCFYVLGTAYNRTTYESKDCIVRITTAGVCSLITTAYSAPSVYPLFSGDGLGYLEINADGTKLFYYTATIVDNVTTVRKICYVTNLTASPSNYDYYTFTTIMTSYAFENFKRYGNNLYLIYYNGTGTTWTIGKFTDIEGSANFADIINTGILYTSGPTSPINSPRGLIPVSDTEIYHAYNAYGTNLGTIAKHTYSGSWSTSTSVTLTDH
jgi:hypothetical protein